MKLIAPVLFLLFILYACASTGGGTKAAIMAPAIRDVRTVYVWDADGHTDLKLLRALKAETSKQLKDKGLLVSNDQNATQAYVKITVLDGYTEEESGKAYLKARLYFIDAAGENVFYDKTAEANSSNNQGYPVEKIVRELLSDYPAIAGK